MFDSTPMPVPIARNLRHVIAALHGATAPGRRPGWHGAPDFAAVCGSLVAGAEDVPAILEQIRETVLELRSDREDEEPMTAVEFRKFVHLGDELAFARTVACLLHDSLIRVDQAARALAA